MCTTADECLGITEMPVRGGSQSRNNNNNKNRNIMAQYESNDP